MKFYYVYILLCSDGTYYTGMTNNLERRLYEHNSGFSNFNYTNHRLPVTLKWYLQCTNPSEAIQLEKQIKGLSKRKKEALINENWEDLVLFSKNYAQYGNRIKKATP